MQQRIHKVEVIHQYYFYSYRTIASIHSIHTDSERILYLLSNLFQQYGYLNDSLIAHHLNQSLRSWKIEQARLVALGLINWNNELINHVA